MTNDHFLITGPAMISFSGGRTSGYMLRRILDAHGGTLPPDVHTVFADTGKERLQTLAFVRECAERWGVSIATVRRAAPEGLTPFDQLIREKSYLPNPVQRFCTYELKVKVMQAYMHARHGDEYAEVIGFRADERGRIASARSKPHNAQRDLRFPLAAAAVHKPDVLAFWAASDFDLQLQPWESNCDLCFLKGTAIRRRIMEDHPELAAWWIAKEAEIGGRFRYDAPDYATLAEGVRRQIRLPFAMEDDPTDLGACECHD